MNNFPNFFFLNFFLAPTLSKNMIYTMLACICREIPDEKVVEPLKVTKAVYRDELLIKKPPLPCKAMKKTVRFSDSEPSAWGQDREKDMVKGGCAGNNEVGERAAIRVKVKMTKEEAARLLSKCKEGGVLEFKDVARELVALPMNRVSVVSTCTSNDS